MDELLLVIQELEDIYRDYYDKADPEVLLCIENAIDSLIEARNVSPWLITADTSR